MISIGKRPVAQNEYRFVVLHSLNPPKSDELRRIPRLFDFGGLVDANLPFFRGHECRTFRYCSTVQLEPPSSNGSGHPSPKQFGLLIAQTLCSLAQPPEEFVAVIDGKYRRVFQRQGQTLGDITVND